MMVQPGKTVSDKSGTSQDGGHVSVTVSCERRVPHKGKPSLTLYKCGLFLSLVLLACSISLYAVTMYWMFRHGDDDIKNGTGIPEPHFKTEPLPSTGVGAKTNFTLEDIFDSSLLPLFPRLSWVNDKNIYLYFSKYNHLMEHDLDKDQRREVIDNLTLYKNWPHKFSMSKDMQYVLITYNFVETLWNMPNFKAKIYDRRAKKMLDFPFDKKLQGEVLQHVAWGENANGLLFVCKNNLHYQSSPHVIHVNISTDGSENVLYNGIANWDYIAWITPGDHLTWMGPGSRYLIYGQLNSTRNKLIRYPYYGEMSDIYPTSIEFAFPKTGGGKQFTDVRLKVVDMKKPDKTIRELLPPEEYRNKDHYLYRVNWQDETHALIGWLNRRQNRSILLLCDVTSGVCQKNLDESRKGGWIDLSKRVPYMFIENGKSYLAKLPKEESSGAWRHLALVTAQMTGPGKVTFLTKGEIEVDTINGYDPVKKVVYYTRTGDNALQRHVYRMGTPAADEIYRDPVCLTCKLPTSCQYVTALFSQSTKHYFRFCQGPGIPTSVLQNTIDDKTVVIEDNAAVEARLAQKRMPTREYREIAIGGGYKGWAQFLLPPNFDPKKKYPTVMFPYGGPNFQQTTYKYLQSMSYFETYMASSEDVITIRLDGRGSGGRGKKFAETLYRRVGTHEVQDQITGAGNIRSQFPYIDGDKIAVYGASYGGFVSAHVIGSKQNVINCGIAIAPVVTYRYIHVGYIERYMHLDTPDDNELGYNISDVSRKVENFRNKNFLLIHGSADDNVHYQHAAHLNKALVQADIYFHEKTYIDQRHHISGRQNQRHWYKTMRNFMKQTCWGLQ